MPYVVKKDGATIAADTGIKTSLRDGSKRATHRTSVYSAGDLLSDKQVAQTVKDKYESGDEKVQSLIEEISQEDYDNAQSAVEFDLSRFQAENGGEVDQPRKIQEAVTKLDVEVHAPEKAKVVENAQASDGDDGSGDGDAAESDANEVGVPGGGDVDEPRKVQDAPTGNELDDELETNTKKSTKKSVKKAGK